MLIAVILLVVSIVLLYFGAEFSLEASEKVGVKIGLSPLAIGMLLVGFGTSLPEFFVGHIAAVKGEVGIALGSLVGSNIANMFLILGVCSLITPLSTKDKSLASQFIVHLFLGIALWFVLTRSVLDVFSASPLIALCGLYLFMLYRDFKQDESISKGQDVGKMGLTVIKMFAGFGMLYLGGELLVKSGTDICDIIGIDTYIVSAIFIAFGTSFPELVTSLIAVKKRKNTNLILGNIIGSNLFNCAFILGSLGIYDFKLSSDFTYEIAALVGGAAFLVLMSMLQKNLNRLTGVLFLGAYTYMVGFWIKVF